MTIELESHPGVKMIDPKVIVIGVYEDSINKTFAPRLLFVAGENVNIGHDMPPQPFVNGTWSDSTRDKAVEKYLSSLDLE